MIFNKYYTIEYFAKSYGDHEGLPVTNVLNGFHLIKAKNPIKAVINLRRIIQKQMGTKNIEFGINSIARVK